MHTTYGRMCKISLGGMTSDLLALLVRKRGLWSRCIVRIERSQRGDPLEFETPKPPFVSCLLEARTRESAVAHPHMHPAGRAATVLPHAAEWCLFDLQPQIWPVKQRPRDSPRQLSVPPACSSSWRTLRPNDSRKRCARQRSCGSGLCPTT